MGWSEDMGRWIVRVVGGMAGEDCGNSAARWVGRSGGLVRGGG